MTATMHVLPVGRSLIGRIDTEPNLASLRPALRHGTFDPAVNPRQKVADELARRADPRTGALDLHGLLDAEQRAAVCQGDPKLCAEWTSVAVERRKAHETAAAFVFIASDTDEGLRSGVLVATYYALGTSAPVTYVADPNAARSMRIDPGGVYLFRVSGLDLGTTVPGDATWLALGSVGHVIARTARQATVTSWSVLLHLTGGYKALMPYLLVMAEGVNSVIRQPDARPSGHSAPGLRAVSVHEHEPDTSIAHLKQITLPIRWLEGTALADLGEIADDTANDLHIFGDRWASYRGQWITDGGGKLTEAGMILTRVL